MLGKATRFAVNSLRIPEGEAAAIAADAVTFAWEECKFGRANAESEPAFWAMISERLYKTRGNWRSREYSLDAPIPNSEGDADGHEAGWNGYMPPDQVEVVYLKQVKAGIELLPSKYTSIMRLLAEGYNALDVAETLRIPLHTVFHRIAEGRRLLHDRELIPMAREMRAPHPSE